MSGCAKSLHDHFGRWSRISHPFHLLAVGVLTGEREDVKPEKGVKGRGQSGRKDVIESIRAVHHLPRCSLPWLGLAGWAGLKAKARSATVCGSLDIHS